MDRKQIEDLRLVCILFMRITDDLLSQGVDLTTDNGWDMITGRIKARDFLVLAEQLTDEELRSRALRIERWGDVTRTLRRTT